MKNASGRPPNPPRFIVSITPRLRRQIDQAAAARELSTSAWVRIAMQEKLDRDQAGDSLDD